MMPNRRRIAFTVCLAVVMTACGGSDDKDPVPEGAALASVWFIDSDSYYPLSKASPAGALLDEGSPDYGTRNTLRRTGDLSMSVWGIDSSAKGPSGASINYSMRIEPITADGSAYNSMVANLKIDAATGLIYQQCSGYPVCYDNSTGRAQEFRITAVARVGNSSKALERPFSLTVLPN